MHRRLKHEGAREVGFDGSLSEPVLKHPMTGNGRSVVGLGPTAVGKPLDSRVRGNDRFGRIARIHSVKIGFVAEPFLSVPFLAEFTFPRHKIIIEGLGDHGLPTGG